MKRGVTVIGAAGDIIKRLLFSAFGLFFAYIGLHAVRSGHERLDEIRAMQSWIGTPCTIVESEIEDHGEDYRLALTYRYDVDGHPYTASRYSASKFLTAESLGEMDRLQKQYAPDTPTTCYYNPSDPAEAVLIIPTLESGRRGAIAGYLFPAFGLFFAVLPWLTGRKKKKDPTTESSPPDERKGRFVLILFGAVFLLAGLLLIKPVLVNPLLKTRAAKSWDRTAATVVSSKVKTHSDSDGNTYSAYIAYRYEVDGREYIGDRYTFTQGSSSGYAGKAEKVRQHPPGRELTIYVNPADPSESVVDPSPSWGLLFGLIPLIFTLVGGGILFAAFRSFRAPALDPRQAQMHVVTLKGKSRLGKLLFLVLFALIWNGVVVILFRSDASLIFRIVFPLFGLFVIGAALHAALGCFNPRPEVELTPGNLIPGTTAALRWRITGRVDRLRRLSVTLQCLKVTTVTRRSGGNSRTSVEKTPIYEEELLHTDRPHELAQGALQFTIPADRPASRRGNSNGIQWQLVFRSDIPRWPDLKEELQFTVYPAD